MDAYARRTLAPMSRCRLWERFREDLERAIRGIMQDDAATVLMMGGVAQGMATVDGDVDLIIFLPNHIPELQQDRGAVRNALHVIGRGLKRQGFDGFVVPARVPIIQYRPDPAIEKLFTHEGSDELVRFLRSRGNNHRQGGGTPQKLQQDLAKQLGVPVKIHNPLGSNLWFEFPLAADAFSAMFRNPKMFDFPHLGGCEEKTGAKRDAKRAGLFAAMKAAGQGGAAAAANPAPADEGAEAPNAASGAVTIDDILRNAAQGRGVTGGGYVPYPFAVDISLAVTDKPWGARNSELLRRYLAADPKVRTLAMFVKWWSKRSVPVAINNSRSGWLTSYCVLVLLIHYLVQAKRLGFIDPATIDPVLTPDMRYPADGALSPADHVQLARDFLGFCEYYATVFDYEKGVVTMLTDAPKTKADCTPKVMSARNTCLVIEDPYEDRSLGHPIDPPMLVQIRATFLAGARGVLRSTAPGEADRVLAAELRQSGRAHLESHFGFESTAGGSCAICRAEPAESGSTECAKCNAALDGAQIPLEFFARRTGQHKKVEEQVHIAEQKRQERALKQLQFMASHHKGTRQLARERAPHKPDTAT
eukprot:TRINITY_DN6702_c0_g6_i1.p1 TRINITY_DN6702_c0_g6~~TRINITY_DN6702_c0_g6_i1.p1  ORF type:complete len:679 (+),score=227.53 TRINITY_DN6702_c0_g6_i1:272-2038(+)